jgi:hypothetical protein
MATTSTKLIVYPTSTDYIAPLETHFANLANSVETALTTKISATEITTGTLAIANGGTGATTATAALTNLGIGGLGDTSYRAGKNYLINGGFDIWQRLTGVSGATSFTNPATGSYTADRWLHVYDAAGSATLTVSKMTQSASNPFGSGDETLNTMRVVWSATAPTAQTINYISQRIEDVRTLANKTVTVSFYAKADSATSRSIGVQFEQNFGYLGNSTATTAITTKPLTTSWARYTVTVAIPSISGATIGADSYLGLRLILPNNTLGTYDIWGVQVEVGSDATSFQRFAGLRQFELQACQRYYYRQTNTLDANAYICTGVVQAGAASGSTSTHWAVFRFAETMRMPRLGIVGGRSSATALNCVTSSGVTSTSVIMSAAILSPDSTLIDVRTNGITLTTGQATLIRFAGTADTSWIDFNAEL